MPLPDIVYLRHMLEAIQRLEGYAARIARDQFDEDPIIQDGFMTTSPWTSTLSGTLQPSAPQT